MLLASSAACPVQALPARAATSTPPSSTPSWTSAGLRTRVEVYRHHGYFDPCEVEALKAMADASAW